MEGYGKGSSTTCLAHHLEIRGVQVNDFPRQLSQTRTVLSHCKDGLHSGGMSVANSEPTQITTTSLRSMTTLLDHKTTLAYLAYLGYPQTQPTLSSPSSSFASSSSAPSATATPSTTTALQVTRPRRADRKKGKVTRNVFLCYVCGAAGSGKTTLLRAFSGKKYTDSYEPTTKPISVVNSVEIGGVEKYLVVSVKSFLPIPKEAE